MLAATLWCDLRRRLSVGGTINRLPHPPRLLSLSLSQVTDFGMSRFIPHPSPLPAASPPESPTVTIGAASHLRFLPASGRRAQGGALGSIEERGATGGYSSLAGEGGGHAAGTGASSDDKWTAFQEDSMALTTNLGTVAWAAPEMLCAGVDGRGGYTAKVRFCTHPTHPTCRPKSAEGNIADEST